MHRIISDSTASIHRSLDAYQKEGLTSTIYRLKDSIIGSNLTQERSELASAFAEAITDFKANINEGMTREELSSKIVELQTLIEHYSDNNQQLSTAHDKDISSGRLAQKFSKLKEELSALRSTSPASPEEVSALGKNIS